MVYFFPKGGIPMKKFTMGLIIGIVLTLSTGVIATTGIEKITAYINSNVNITIDGEKFNSEYPTIVYDGRTYLPLRTIGEDVMGMEVGWDDVTKTVVMTSVIAEEDAWPMETVTQPVTETTYKGLKAITVDSETYFELRSYSNKFDPISWGYNRETNEVYLAKHIKGSTEIEEVLLTLSGDEIMIYKGASYLNIKHYQE